MSKDCTWTGEENERKYKDWTAVPSGVVLAGSGGFLLKTHSITI